MPLSPDDVTKHLKSDGSVAWTTLAQLLVSGSQSCVDGRDHDAVLGTPGGDAGEYLLNLACIERLTGRAIDDGELESLFDRFLLHFGRFYMHTDRHAVDNLAESLRADDAFTDVAGDSAKTEALVRQPGERSASSAVQAATSLRKALRSMALRVQRSSRSSPTEAIQRVCLLTV